MSEFYGYTVRKTTEADALAAYVWSERSKEYRFWLRQEPERENFIVFEGGKGLGFYQIETLSKGTQARIHMQASPAASPKKILAAITKLVPLLEKALAGRGVRAIFFTSKSEAMAQFMAQRFRYEYAGQGGADGVIMAKGLLAVGSGPLAKSQEPTAKSGMEL